MADYLEDDEIVDRIRAWWRENGTSLVGVLVLVLGGWGGWNWYATHSEEQAEAAFVHFADYVAKRESGEADSEGAIEALARLDSDYAGSGGHVLSLLYLAADAVQSDDMAGAIMHLQAALAASPRGPVEALVRLRLARVYLQDEALDAALGILQDLDDEDYVAVREELRGDVLLEMGRTDEARAAYQAADESQSASEANAAWPFAEMKRYGLDFHENDADVESDAVADTVDLADTDAEGDRADSVAAANTVPETSE
ncbi:MAG: tetratricopeptide repeat protein [Gammaproteobacteria bacterium]|nr:tetratricopeptide repeat protein [Gammaproteobacteria bacterium]